ncbi:MAG: hypothetical protein ACO225_13985, partial [Ilumatobacteraceae bacterium]
DVAGTGADVVGLLVVGPVVSVTSGEVDPVGVVEASSPHPASATTATTPAITNRRNPVVRCCMVSSGRLGCRSHLPAAAADRARAE